MSTVQYGVGLYCTFCSTSIIVISIVDENRDRRSGQWTITVPTRLRRTRTRTTVYSTSTVLVQVV